MGKAPKKPEAADSKPVRKSAGNTETGGAAPEKRGISTLEAQAMATAAAAKEHAVFETAEDFAFAADRYFAECDANGELYSAPGLCLGLKKYGPKGRSVALKTLLKWLNGESCPYLQETVQDAFLRIQRQIETDPRYMEKGGMTTRAIFLLKQQMYGGYVDRKETKNEGTVNVLFGKDMEKSDFE